MSELLLGPPGADKIAIVGSAPTSVQLAPYRDMTWSIWGCSPGVYGVAPRKDAWFELHRWETQEPGFPQDPHAKSWFSPEYARYMELFEGPVFMSQPIPSVKNCVLFPYDRLIKRHGPYHFTSTVAWMLAYAIEQKPKAIGLWGIDMAAGEEYARQRPGCQHFLGLAKSMGIEIILPLESDLLQPCTMYGISEMHPRHAKLLARMNELKGRLQAHEQQQAFHASQALFLKGALDNLNYVFDHWVDDVSPDISYAISRSATIAAIPDPVTSMKLGGWPDEATPNREQAEIVMPERKSNGETDWHDEVEKTGDLKAPRSKRSRIRAPGTGRVPTGGTGDA